jgi:DNA-binding Xre family transcriptional regulator
MAQTTTILKALKRLLKRHGYKYSDVANALGISESRVKFLFSQEDFSLKRMDVICQMMGIEISDVLAEMREIEQIKSLTEQQEKELVSDTSLLLVANSVLNRWNFDDIIQAYEFKETELIRHLAKLDQLKLIHLLPGNKIKLLVDRHFSWIKNGPINRYFEEQVRQEFFNSRFSAPGEKQMFLVGMLSRESNAIFQRKLDNLSNEFHSLHYEDEKLPVKDRFGTSVIIGMRMWEPKEFESRRREKDSRKF